MEINTKQFIFILFIIVLLLSFISCGMNKKIIAEDIAEVTAKEIVDHELGE